MKPDIILVDRNDNQTGVGSKMPVHRAGKLHRAFSVFIFNDNGELMIQRRDMEKYHNGGLWANTCCSHPYPCEKTTAAGERRLKQELGFTTNLRELFAFVYKNTFDNGLTEYEYDHVLIGNYNDSPTLNPKEVMDWKWVKPERLELDMRKEPNNYTIWLKIALKKVLEAK